MSQTLHLFIVLSQMRRTGFQQPMEVTDYQGALVSEAPLLPFMPFERPVYCVL